MSFVVETECDRPSSAANTGGAKVSAFLNSNYKSLRIAAARGGAASQIVRISGPRDRKCYSAIRNYAEIVNADNRTAVYLGGDHRATLHILRAAASTLRIEGLIVFDAHTDCQGLDEPLSNYNVLGIIRKEFPALRMALIGVRDQDVMAVRRMGIFDLILDADEFNTFGLAAALKSVRRSMAGLRCYMSIDLDVLDPLVFPCVSAPISGGLLPAHLLAFVKALKPMLFGADIVEFVGDQASPLHYLFIADLYGQLTVGK